MSNDRFIVRPFQGRIRILLFYVGMLPTLLHYSPSANRELDLFIVEFIFDFD